MASKSPATSSSWGRRSAAVAGAGVASTTASAAISWLSDVTVHPPAGACQTVGRRGASHVHAARLQARGERAHQRGHAAVERPEERRPVGVGRRDLGPQGPHEAAPPLRGRQQRRERRRSRHVVDRAGMDAADERIDQHVDDAAAELARHQGSDRTVADGPAGVGSGQHGVAGEPERCRAGRRCPNVPWARSGWGRRGHALRAAGAVARGPRPTRRGRRSARASRRARPRGTSRRPRSGVRGTRRGRRRRHGHRHPCSAAARRGAAEASSRVTVGASLRRSPPR